MARNATHQLFMRIAGPVLNPIGSRLRFTFRISYSHFASLTLVPQLVRLEFHHGTASRLKKETCKQYKKGGGCTFQEPHAKPNKMRSLLVFLTILGPVLCNPNFNGTIYQSRIPAYGNVAQGNFRLHPRQGCDLGYSLCAGTGPV